jgi:hypothetical protein
MNSRRFAATLIATTLILVPVALAAPASRASAASGCMICAARPAQVVSTH